MKSTVMIIAQRMDIALKTNVSVIKDGSARPVRRLPVKMTVQTMEYVLKASVTAEKASLETHVISSPVLMNATEREGVIKESANVKADGAVKTVQFAIVKTRVPATEYVTLQPSRVNALLVSSAPTARLKSALTTVRNTESVIMVNVTVTLTSQVKIAPSQAASTAAQAKATVYQENASAMKITKERIAHSSSATAMEEASVSTIESVYVMMASTESTVRRACVKIIAI